MFNFNFEIPNNREDFMNHEIWGLIGFNIKENFRIEYINRNIKLESSMTYGQESETLLISILRL